MNVAVRIGMTADAERVIEARQGDGKRIRAAIQRAITQTVSEAEANVKMNYARGGDPNSRRDGKSPLAVRSGALFSAITGKRDEPLSGFVGVIKGAATKYARTQLGPDDTTIKPKNANHLWLPIADNRTKSGQMRMSPSEAFEKKGPKGGQLLSVFESKQGNLVAFLRDPKGGTFKRGKNKGRQRGKLLFVLKEEVTIKGTDALALGVLDMRERAKALLDMAVMSRGDQP